MRFPNKPARLAAALAAGALLAACAAGQEPRHAAQTSSNVVEGQRLAEVYCSSCHAIGTEGESRHAMAPPFRTLSRNYPVNALEEAFAEGILVGHRDMPEFRLEPDQIEDLLGYIESIQERRAG
jgi:mono/diheme cytochrome c family protein